MVFSHQVFSLKTVTNASALFIVAFVALLLTNNPQCSPVNITSIGNFNKVIIFCFTKLQSREIILDNK
jgi:hypothetical protein